VQTILQGGLKAAWISNVRAKRIKAAADLAAAFILSKMSRSTPKQRFNYLRSSWRLP